MCLSQPPCLQWSLIFFLHFASTFYLSLWDQHKENTRAGEGVSLSLHPSSGMLDSAQNTQIPLTHSPVVLEKTYQIQLIWVSVSKQLQCWPSPVLQIKSSQKQKRKSCPFSLSAPEKTGSLWLMHYLSIIITNELTSIPPLESIFRLEIQSLRLYFLMCSVLLSW